MSTINLAKSYRAYSPQELREMAYQGLLEVNGFDMSDFLEYIFTDYKVETSEEEVEAIKDEAYDRGWSDAKGDAIAAVENI